MLYKNLGKTTLQISQIGFGCMSLGKNTEADSISLVHEAIDAGINYFDTADMYDKGANETLLGRAIKGLRDKVVVATKVGNQWREDGSGWNWNPSRDYILDSVEGSLRRLQTDHIDLYQLHGGTINDPIDETIEAFELLKQQGKILHYGISSIRPNVLREYVNRSAVESVMLQYSLLDRRPEEELLSLLQQHQVSVMVRGALAQGLLVDKPPKDYLGHAAADIEKAVNALVANAEFRTAAALGFVLGNAAVTSAVIGFRTSGQLRAALQPGITLPAVVMEQVNAAIPAKKYQEHR